MEKLRLLVCVCVCVTCVHYEEQAETLKVCVCVHLLTHMQWGSRRKKKTLGWRGEQFQTHPNLCIWPWNKAVILKLIIDAC